MKRGGGTPPGPWWGRRSVLHLPRFGGGRGGESSQPQPDSLEDKSPLYLEGERRVPSLAPSPPQAKRRREERERGTDRSRAPDFQEKSARRRSPAREHPQPHGHDHRALRLPARGLPHCGHCPQGTHTFIGASYALIVSKRSSARMYPARWTKRSTPTPSPTRFGNGLKPASGNLAHRPDHTCARIIRLKPVTARSLGPCNRRTLRRSLHQQTLIMVCLNCPDTRSRAITVRLVPTWTIQPVTADMKLSDRKRLRQYRSAVTPSLPSHAVIIRGGLLLCPREADTHPCILFRTPTH